MKTRKMSSSSRATKNRTSTSRASGTKKDSASSMVLQLIGSVVGDSLSESVSNLKNKVTEQVSIHGQEYLESARERITEATSKVVKWGKEHPVKTVAAAAALIAVTGFLYATLNGKAGQVARQTKSKLKVSAGQG
jgi:ElaB/YqjD/DUF883 family membrane-anchored ribosome-binding protein